MRTLTRASTGVALMMAPLLISLPASAHAATDGKATPRVFVVRDQAADAVVLEVANRTRAELAAAGLDATITECPSLGATCGVASGLPSVPSSVPTPGRAPAVVVIAVVSTIRHGDQTVTQVQIVTGDGPPSLVRRVSVDQSSPAGDDPAVLAVRAAELVFATLSQTAEPSPASRSPAPESAADPAMAPISFDFELPDNNIPPPAGAAGWFAGAGAAVLGTHAGVGMAYGGMLRAGYVGLALPALTVAALLAAPALSSELHAINGRIATRQELAALELSYHFRLRAVIQPRLSLGVGGYHITARGILADTGRQTGSRDAWALLMIAGGGVALALAHDIALFVDAQLVLARPYPSIVLGTSEARAAHPSLLVALGAQRVF